MILSRESTIIIESVDDWILEGYWNELKTFNISKVIHSYNKKKLAQLHYEIELAHELDVPTIMKPIFIEQEEQFLKMNYSSKIAYKSLAAYIASPLSTYNFLRIAIKLTNCFIDLHQASYIYRNLHAKHFLIDTQTLDIKLLHLEYSYQYSNFKPLPETAMEIPKHRLAYLAPEETGRVNSEIDFRTDLYSLGVLFYEMIAGQTPYDEKHPAFFNKMLTTDPPTFKELGIKVPPIIEKIVSKLLSKNKTNRYQSAIGLKEDLTSCLHLFTNDLLLDDFPLGQHDQLGESRLNVKIPDRQRMLDTLLQKVQAPHEQSQIHFIKGEDKSGKSYFLSTLYNALQLDGHSLLMLSKNSSHSHTKIPVFILAIRQQLDLLEKLDEKTKLLIEKRLVQANILIPQSIFYYFPSLEHYKKQLTIVDDWPNVKQEHFFSILAQLINVFLQPTKPVTVLIDDWDKLDEDSFKFVTYLMQQKENYLFVVTNKTARFKTEQLFPSNCSVIEHELRYLSAEHVLEWVQQSFNSQEEALQQLAQFLFETTKGSPLLIQEIFRQICEQKLLKFDHYERKWNFNMATSQIIGNIPAYRSFIDQQMGNLSSEQQLVLKYAGCIGKSFQVDILLHVVPLEQETTLQIYLSLLEKHLFIAKREDTMLLRSFLSLNITEEITTTARFFNEDVFEAAVEITSTEEKCAIHYAIYLHLKEKVYQMERKRLMVHHLSFCADKINALELQSYLQLNFELGTETILNGMYSESLVFSQNAFTTLASLKQIENSQLKLETYVLYANALYLNKQELQANEIFDKAVQQCQTLYDRLFVYNEKILFLTMKSADTSDPTNLKETLEIAHNALKPFKIPLKTNVSAAKVAKEYFLLKAALRKHPANELLQLTPNTNKEVQLILKLLMNILGISMLLDEKLFAWIIIRAVRLIVKHGDLDIASVFYGNYSNLLLVAMKDFNESYRFGLLSIEHLKKYDAHLLKGNVYMNFGLGISSLKKSYDTSIYYLKQLQKTYPDDSLHRLYNATASAYILSFQHFQGVDLHTLKSETAEHAPYLDATNNDIPKSFVEELLYWIHILENPKEKVNWQLPIAVQTRTSFFEGHLILRLQMSYLLFDRQQAEHIIEQLKAYNSVFTINQPHYYFYKALWLFRFLDDTHHKKEQGALWKEIKYCIKQIEVFAKNSPQNFEHFLALLKALYYQHTKQTMKAQLHFDRAIQLAKLINNLRDEAIAKLNTALFYETEHDVSKAHLYMQSAIQSLYAWKAPRVVQLLAERFSHLWKKSVIVTDTVESQSMNIEPIVSMYQMIAKENDVKTLLQKSLLAVINHLDAEQIYLFKIIDETPVLQAYVNSVDNDYEYYTEAPAIELPKVILKGVQQVIESETYLLNNVNAAHIGSTLWLPLFVKGRLEAVIYCTNNLVTSLFTKQKIDVVTVLATQMLLAVENIERQKILEQQVATRTVELSEANEQLTYFNNRLQQNEDQLKRFIQHISHDLRTPITSVLGYVEALSGDLVKDEEKRKLYLDRSKIRLLSLNNLIQDLFDISRLQGGHIEFNKEQIPITQLFAIIDEAISNDLEQATIHYVSSFNGHDAIVQVDVNRFMQVIHNMTNNILKYANEGTVELTFTCKEHVLEISLRDEGVGIPAKELPFVFDLNFKASNNHSNKESYGICLAICKQIVDHHNGTIQVASEENKGTTFTITLPCAPLEDAILQ